MVQIISELAMDSIFEVAIRVIDGIRPLVKLLDDEDVLIRDHAAGI